jgi:sugar/nucleoside kinase (ribokinase family)
MPNQFLHILGDAFVDHFCFLDGDWPEKGGDALLHQPIRSYAGGSSVNTATHYQSLVTQLSTTQAPLILHTVLNENDPFGQMLLEHAQKHNFSLINCRRPSDTSSTGHCIAIVSKGERTFMTHPGCVHHFTAKDVSMERIIQHEGDVHIHVAGYFNITGFWHGTLRELLQTIRSERTKRYPLHSTTISLVTQHDASNQWDGGIDDVLSCLDFLIVNELEANRIMQRGRKDKSIPLERNDPLQDWISFWSPLNPEACIVVTRGSEGAVAFRNGQVLASLSPAVPVPVVDPTGAGDAFAAGFLYGIWSEQDKDIYQTSHQRILSAQDIANGLQWGCAVGTASVEVRGASVPCHVESIREIYKKQRANR